MTAPFDDSPAPRHPQLEAMIRAARAQAAPPTKVRFEDVRAAAHRRSTWRMASLAAAAGLLAVVAWAWPHEETEETDEGAPTVAVAEVVPETADPATAPDADAVDAVVPPTAVPDLEVEQHANLVEGGVIVERIGEGPTPTMALEDGRFRVRTRDQAVALSVGAKVLEIAAASEVFIDTTQPEVTFEVHAGRAKWAEQAQRREKSTQVPSAPNLAAQAEAAILKRNHAEAARLLRKLVRLHPSSAAAKAGLIDLARLEKTLGNQARAHCAYASFLSRFPSDARAPSVRTADGALGLSTIECRGLNPRAN